MRKTVYLFALLSLCMVTWAQNPVAINGRLQVKGKKLCNKDGVPIQLKGMSSHGLQWTNNCLKKSSIAALRNDWGSDVFRISMYVEESGYNTDTARFIAKVDSLVDWCTEVGLYVIIDWHILTPGDPLDPAYKGAFTFFSRMAKRFGKHENVLFELCNEPNGDMATWARIKQYAQPIVTEIRKYSQNIIIVGTPNWSQYVFEPGQDPIDCKNLMYTFHFYSSSHDNLKNLFSQTIPVVPLFVTEWGPTASDGTSDLDTSKALDWVKIMNDNQISWTSWSFSDLKISTSVLKEGSCDDNAWNNTTAEGGFMKRQIQARKTEANYVVKENESLIIYAFSDQNRIILSTTSNMFIKGLMNEREFTVLVNGISIPVLSVYKEFNNTISLLIDHKVIATDLIYVSYTGNGLIETGFGSRLKKIDMLLADNSDFPSYSNRVVGTGYYTNFDSTKTVIPFVVGSYAETKLVNNALNINCLGSNSWQSVYVTIPACNISKKMIVTLSIKSTVSDSISFDYSDTLHRVSNLQLKVKLIGDNKYHDYSFAIVPSSNYKVDSTCVNMLVLGFNGTKPFVGSVAINKLIVGDSIAYTPIQGVTLSTRTLSIKAEEQVKLGVDYMPANILIPETWLSLNPAIAKVSPAGVVQGITEGSTRVVAYWQVNNKTLRDTCVVTVNNGGEIKRKQLNDCIAKTDRIKTLAEGTTTQALYDATAVENLSKVIADARVLAQSASATQKSIDSMVVVLNDSLVALCKTGKSNNYTALVVSLQKLDFALSAITVGTRAGEYPATAVEKLTVVKNSTLAFIETMPLPKQADSAKLVVDAAIVEFKNSVIAQTAHFNKLDSVLAVARAILDTAPASKYPKAEYALFSGAVDKALQVDYYFGATQAEIDKAQADLELSIAAFKMVKPLVVSTVAGSVDAFAVDAFPNPFMDLITVRVSDAGAKRVSVASLLGVVLFDVVFEGKDMQLSCAAWPSGVYLLTITAPDGQQTVLRMAK